MAARASTVVRLTICCALGLTVFGRRDAAAQRGVLRGVVSDSTGAPIDAADVAIVSVHQLARTDSHGFFTMTSLPRGDLEVSIRRLGYEAVTMRVTITDAYADSVNVKLVALPDVLAAMKTSAPEARRRIAIEQFYQRRARGIGTFYTRDDIADRHAVATSDLLRSAPGVQVVRVAGGSGIRFSSANGRRNCPPLIWIDGQKAPGMEVDQIPLSDIEGIEVYQGNSSTPTQFWQNTATTCGTIVVWSRRSGA